MDLPGRSTNLLNDDLMLPFAEVLQQLKAVGASLSAWVPLMAILTYAVVGVLAQLRLDVLSALF